MTTIDYFLRTFNPRKACARLRAVTSLKAVHRLKAVPVLAAVLLLGGVGLERLGLVTAVYAQQSEFPGKRIVPILQEPRHRTVHRNGELILLDVQINPGDMTLPHTHDAAILYTFISNGDGPLGGRVSSITDYVEENLTHEVENPGPHLFRILALTNYGPPSAGNSDAAEGVAVETELENSWFRSWRFTLQPGESTTLQRHKNPAVVIQVSDGLLHVSRFDGITAELDAMGDWAWRDADQWFRVTNMGEEATEFVVNEGRI